MASRGLSEPLFLFSTCCPVAFQRRNQNLNNISHLASLETHLLQAIKDHKYTKEVNLKRQFLTHYSDR